MSPRRFFLAFLTKFLILLILIIVGVSFYFLLYHKPAPEKSDLITKDWKTFSDQAAGITFKYPENISTTYIHAVDWPPKVQVMNAPLTCTETGSEIAPAGKTVKKTIGGNEYCVTEQGEGAAGSIYTQYAYATEMKNKTVIFTFTLRSVQCENYDDPQKTACKTERAAFNVDTFINQIIQTTNLL